MNKNLESLMAAIKYSKIVCGNKSYEPATNFNLRKFIFNFIDFFLSFFLYYPHTGKGLTQLDVSQNQLQNVPSSALKNLHHLLILNLNHNKISVIHNRAFEGLDTLEILTLYENKISVIEPDAFRGLDK